LQFSLLNQIILWICIDEFFFMVQLHFCSRLMYVLLLVSPPLTQSSTILLTLSG
jgi:hypothetical protein